MKKGTLIFFLLACVILPLGCRHVESAPGSPPVITHWFASERINRGDIWKIYLEANDPDGDMRHFVCAVDQVGYGPYSAQYAVIKKEHREKLKGYLRFFTSGGMGLQMSEWTRFNVTVYIRDSGRLTSNKVVLPLVLSQGPKQGPPPPPFDSGPLDRLGVISIELIDPSRGPRAFYHGPTSPFRR
jgi:hypothetical protein